MSDQLIKDFPVLTDAQADDGTRLLPSGVAASGKLYSFTVTQAKLIFSTQRHRFDATGSEGVTITVAALAARTILAVFREGMCIYDVVSGPSTVEYTWNGTSITLGLATSAGEHFLILYKNA